eukprot:GHVU01220861.1.p1 GENE.GHVU01220861.1~~GHVU01220861.1.p1  ORF type:complete len:109 (+),score=16.38 GHVU01220861.1:900-1226(+)
MALSTMTPELQKQSLRPVIKESTMTAELQADVLDVVLGAIEKCTSPSTTAINVEAAARLIKDTLDKQHGVPWHCFVGPAYSYAVTSQDGSHMLCFVQGSVGVLVFKSS